MRIDGNRDLPFPKSGQGCIEIGNSAGLDIFDCSLAFKNCVGEGYRSSDDEGLGQFSDEHIQPGAMQANGRTAGQVSPTAYECDKSLLL